MRSLLLFIAIALSAFTMSAQRFNGGLLAGFNACQVDGDTYAGYNKFGLAFGAFTNTGISEKISGELQIRFMQKGASKKVTENDLSKYVSKLNYIELPVLLRYNQTSRLSWHLGPGFGYLFKYTVEDENGPLNSDAIKFRSFDLSAMAGIQYKLAKKIGISVTFSYSLIPISDHPNDPIHFRQPGLYNNVVTTLLSYQFN